MADEHGDDGWELERDSQPELPTGKAFLRFQVMRAIDMTGALTGLLLFAPVVGVIALLIRLDSRGPELLKQLRCGYRDQEFWIPQVPDDVYGRGAAACGVGEQQRV